MREDENLEDDFTKDVEKLKQMKKQQVKKLREARQMVEKLERSLTKIEGQLEYINYKREGAGDSEVEKELVETEKKELEG